MNENNQLKMLILYNKRILIQGQRPVNVCENCQKEVLRWVGWWELRTTDSKRVKRHGGRSQYLGGPTVIIGFFF